MHEKMLTTPFNKSKKKEQINEKLVKNVVTAERNIMQLNKIIYIDTSIIWKVLPGIFKNKQTNKNKIIQKNKPACNVDLIFIKQNIQEYVCIKRF